MSASQRGALLYFPALFALKRKEDRIFWSIARLENLLSFLGHKKQHDIGSTSIVAVSSQTVKKRNLESNASQVTKKIKISKLCSFHVPILSYFVYSTQENISTSCRKGCTADSTMHGGLYYNYIKNSVQHSFFKHIFYTSSYLRTQC